MAEADYWKVQNGEVLKKLESGLEIVRRTKHEWKDELKSLSGDRLRRKTDKIRGSKFFVDWSLSVYVQWLEEQLTTLDWDRDTEPGSHTVELAHPVGYSNGKVVSKITIVLK